MIMHSPKNQRISELYNIIQQAQKELQDIRSECKHDEGYHITWYSWRIGAMSPSRICDVCDQCIDGITEEESKAFREAEEKRQAEWRKANGISEIDLTTGTTVYQTT